MNGCWRGCYKGTNSGQIIVEIDDRGTCFEGFAYTFDNNSSLPYVFAIIRTADKQSSGKIQAPLAPLDPQGGEPTVWQAVASRYPNILFPEKADIEYEWSDQSLRLRWNTNIGTFGSAEITKDDSARPSDCKPLPIYTWTQFKEYVTGLERYRYIFRGQSSAWRLRTPFHRTGRGDLRRFFLNDVSILHKHLTARTKHVFDLANPIQYAAFLNLVQHHGYPTPLLDWTYSPFVAAFFAYREIKSSRAAGAAEDDRVRIFLFDKVQWCSDFVQILQIAPRFPHFSIIEPIAIENERLIPQQALSSFTTVYDIETYVRAKEVEKQRCYLQVIDLPTKQRDNVIRELHLMGVTAGSLFPGLDGACEELKERFFSM